MTFNPYLAGLKVNAAEPNKGGSDNIERPTAVENIPWQTRPAALTPFEDALAPLCRRCSARVSRRCPTSSAG